MIFHFSSLGFYINLVWIKCKAFTVTEFSKIFLG